MSAPRRLVIFAEGQGGVQATHNLVCKQVQRPIGEAGQRGWRGDALFSACRVCAGRF